MRKMILLLVTCLGMWACSGDVKEQKPDELIPEREMALILIDAHLGEAGLLQTPRDRDSNQALYARYMEQVYQKHKVDPKVFQESYNYYARDPKKFDAIYLVVVDSLSSMEGKSGYVPSERMDGIDSNRQMPMMPDSIKKMKMFRNKKKGKE